MYTFSSKYSDFGDFFNLRHQAKDYRIETTDETITIEVDIPGCAKEDCEISYKNQRIAIEAKIRDQSFSWSFTLNKQLDTDAITADLKNGVLTIYIPKRPEAQPRQIEIT